MVFDQRKILKAVLKRKKKICKEQNINYIHKSPIHRDNEETFSFNYNDLFIIKLCFQQIVKEYMHAWNRIDRTKATIERKFLLQSNIDIQLFNLF